MFEQEKLNVSEGIMDIFTAISKELSEVDEEQMLMLKTSVENDEDFKDTMKFMCNEMIKKGIKNTKLFVVQLAVLIQILEIRSNIEAERSIEDIEEDKDFPIEYYLDLAESIDIRDLSLSDMLNVTPKGIEIIMDARRALELKEKTEQSARCHQIARYVYVYETCDMGIKTKKAFLEHLRKLYKEFGKSIEKMKD